MAVALNRESNIDSKYALSTRPDTYTQTKQHEYAFKEHKTGMEGVDLLNKMSDVSGRSILKDLGKTRVPEHVASRANSIFLRLHLKTKRRRQRDLVIFFCVYEAYRSLKLEKIGEPSARLAYTIDPMMLYQDLKFKPRPKKISKFMNDAYKAYGLGMGYTPVVVYNTVEEFVHVFFEYTGLEIQSLTVLIVMTRRIMQKDPSLANRFPQKVAAAIIAYYFDTISSKPPDNFYDRIVKTPSMISDLKSVINKIDNN